MAEHKEAKEDPVWVWTSEVAPQALNLLYDTDEAGLTVDVSDRTGSHWNEHAEDEHTNDEKMKEWKQFSSETPYNYGPVSDFALKTITLQHMPVFCRFDAPIPLRSPNKDGVTTNLGDMTVLTAWTRIRYVGISRNGTDPTDLATYTDGGYKTEGLLTTPTRLTLVNSGPYNLIMGDTVYFVPPCMMKERALDSDKFIYRPRVIFDSKAPAIYTLMPISQQYAVAYVKAVDKALHGKVVPRFEEEDKGEEDVKELQKLNVTKGQLFPEQFSSQASHSSSSSSSSSTVLSGSAQSTQPATEQEIREYVRIHLKYQPPTSEEVKSFLNARFRGGKCLGGLKTWGAEPGKLFVYTGSA
jgi:hypothetical protein